MFACRRYDLAEEHIKAFTRSSVRAKVLLCLKDGDKTSKAMESEMGVRNTTILHVMNEMIKADLVTKTEKGYALTNIGQIQAVILDDLASSIDALDEHREFWLNHDIGGIPVNLQVKMGMLFESEVVKGDKAAILRPQEYFMSKLKEAKEIYGVSPIIIPGYAESIAMAVANGANVRLILTEEILEIVAKDYPDSIRGLLEQPNFKLYKIKEKVAIAFTVTDSIFSLGLFRQDGGYDVGSDLICSGRDALAWGTELFEHYSRVSQIVQYI
jgi:predicted transcriptional regulator